MMHKRRQACRAAILLALGMLTGCTPAPARQVVGAWVVDEQQGMLGLLAKTGIKIQFAADGALTISTDAPGTTVTKTGTWRFVEAQERNVVLESTLDGSSPVRMLVEIVDDNHIRLAPPGMPSAVKLTFRRAT